jgi:hypothetical protein
MPFTHIIADNNGMNNDPFTEGDYNEANISLISNVHLNFQSSSDQYTNRVNEEAKLAPTVNTLRLFPNSRVIVTGSGGLNLTDQTFPFGNTPQVLEAPATLNGQQTTTRALLNARAT